MKSEKVSVIESRSESIATHRQAITPPLTDKKD